MVQTIVRVIMAFTSPTGSEPSVAEQVEWRYANVAPRIECWHAPRSTTLGFQQPCGFAVQPYSQPKAPILLSMTTTAVVLAGNPIRPRPVWRPWLLGWLGIIPLAILNGTLRELVYKDRVGPMAGHYISTLVLISLVSCRFSAPIDQVVGDLASTYRPGDFQHL
jgi:hypothetical protein